MKAILEITIIMCCAIFFVPAFVRGMIDLCKVLINPKRFDEVYDQFIEREEKRWK